MKYINKIDSISQDLFYHALESLRLIPIGGEIIFLAEGIEIPPLICHNKQLIDT